jgi:hypothetical protein
MGFGDTEHSNRKFRLCPNLLQILYYAAMSTAVGSSCPLVSARLWMSFVTDEIVGRHLILV